jgi:hypothetical protein
MKNAADEDFDDWVFGSGGFSSNSIPISGLTQLHDLIQQLPVAAVVHNEPEDQPFDDHRQRNNRTRQERIHHRTATEKNIQHILSPWSTNHYCLL